MHKYILTADRQPQRCDDIIAWGKWFEAADDRVVGLHRMGDVRVSTVFLGLDHSFTGGDPVLFETMIFGGPYSDSQWRYRTWEEAERGHAAIVEAVTSGRDPNELSIGS